MSDKPKLRPVDEPIAPQAAGNPDAAADLAIDQEHLEEYVNSGSEGEPGDVVCQRPPRGIFFTVPPEPSKPWQNRGFFWFLEIENRDPFIVHPSIAEQKKDEEDTLRPVLIVRYTTMSGDEALWALKLDPPEGKSNSYNRSAMNILELAQKGFWMRIMSAQRGQQKNKSYRYQKSKKTLEQVPPKYSQRTFKELIDQCFKDRVITDLDHEIWEILANGSTK